MREITETKKVFKFQELNSRSQENAIEEHKNFIKENVDVFKVLKNYYQMLENDFNFDSVEIKFSKFHLNKGVIFDFSGTFTFEYEEQLTNFFHAIKFPYDNYPDFFDRLISQYVDLEIYTYRNAQGYHNLEKEHTLFEIAIGDHRGTWDKEDADDFRNELRKSINNWYKNLCLVIQNELAICVHEATHYVNVLNDIERLGYEYYEDGSVYIPQ